MGGEVLSGKEPDVLTLMPPQVIRIRRATPYLPPLNHHKDHCERVSFYSSRSRIVLVVTFLINQIILILIQSTFSFKVRKNIEFQDLL